MEDRIQHLLDLYWEGETSTEEENELRLYFNAGNVRKEHESFAPLFQYFQQQQHITSPEFDLEKLVSRANMTPVSGTVRIRKLNWVYAAAAIFVLGLASWFLFRNQQSDVNLSPSYVQEIEDPEEAYRVTMEALALVSGKLNKGTESIQLGLENVHKASIIK